MSDPEIPAHEINAADIFDKLSESEEPETEEEPEEPVVEARPRVTQLHKHRGRPKGVPNKPKEQVYKGGYAASPEMRAAATDAPEGMDPREAFDYWPRILEDYRNQGIGPEHLTLKIFRRGLGAFPTPPESVDIIDGAMVCGDGYTDAGQAICDYITNVIHRTTRGPAEYKIHVKNKLSSGQHRMMVFVCPDAAEVMAQQARKQQYLRSKGPTGPMSAMPNVPLPIGVSGFPQAPPQPLPTPPQPQPGQNPLEYLQQAYQFVEQIRASVVGSLPQPPPSSVAASPSVPPELVKEFADMRAELATLKAQKEAENIARTMLSDPNVALGLGYVRASAAPQAPAPAQAVQTASTTPIGALKQLLTDIKELETVKGQFGKILGLAEPVEPEEPAETKDIDVLKVPLSGLGGKPPWLIPQNTDGVVDFVQKWIASNPERGMELGLKGMEIAAGILDKTNFGTMIKQMIEKGGIGAQVATQAQAAGMIGTGQPKPTGPMG